MFTFKSSAFPILAVLSLTTALVNASTYLGCTDTAFIGSSNPPALTPSTLDQCDSYCKVNYPQPYYYYRASGSGLCFCSDVSPAAGDYDAGSSQQGGCASSDDYLAYSTKTSFQFQGCYANMVTDKAPSDQADLATCFSLCANEGSVMIYPNQNNDAFGCRCNMATTIQGGSGNERTCGPNVWFTFTHSAGATASGLAKRNLKEKLLSLRREQSKLLCPSGLNPCSVQGTNTYECIDTTTELESCGGCMSGQFHSSQNATIGVDCSSLPGVAKGAVTCTNSQCQAFACKEGYQLESGLCTKIA
ncbi:uncharacterized protein L201_005955 [Kwoniella dendrophila CBS 6074]|uniref:Protein CPL1-like domain-containing protein n=1 Tax=Kwoniella dendrophila CBS 6074 TaxID=1295534 RepID=A0AAX4K060_9TREE